MNKPISLFLHLLTTLTLLSLSLADSTTTITTHITSTTTTTINISSPMTPSVIYLPTSPLNSNSPNALSTVHESSCTCLMSGAWCGSRSAKQIGLAGTCAPNTLYLCKDDGDQEPQDFDCINIMDTMFKGESGQAGQCMEAMLHLAFNDDCNIAKKASSYD